MPSLDVCHALVQRKKCNCGMWLVGNHCFGNQDTKPLALALSPPSHITESSLLNSEMSQPHSQLLYDPEDRYHRSPAQEGAKGV